MKLKSIEIKGFKSFYKKTKIDFPDGLISIVGPNGSGKSNILDAFRWVLGEQSAKNLRGEKMDDVIFSGTSRYGASNFCEVELIIDNHDEKLNLPYSEISIKRKLYKDGDNVYYINNKSARLKDIKELFLDSGIGKEGYSIISQGKINDIVTSSSFDRRKILEEASGIATYRYKKEISEKNIKSAQENLDRLLDIYNEIDAQIKPLEIQRNKALEYLELKNKYEKLDLDISLIKFSKLSVSLKDLNNYLETLNNKLENIEVEITKLDIDIKNNDAKKEELDFEFKKILSDEQRVNITKNQLLSDISKDNQIKDIKQATQNKISHDISELKRKDILNSDSIKSLKEKLDNIISEEVALNKSKDSSFNLILKLEEKMYSLNNVIEDLNLQKEIITNDINRLNFDNNYIERSITAKHLEYDGIETKILDLETKIKNINTKIYNTKSAISDFYNDIENINKKVVEIRNNIDNLNKEKEKIDKILLEKEKIRFDIKSKCELYNNIHKTNEGLNKSVKSVLDNKNISGIVDIVANIINTEKKYEKAIEIALGSSIQNIITRDSSSAKLAINYLKSKKLGRATFLPLDNIKSAKLILEKETLCSDVVNYDIKYKNVIELLLGRTILADDIDSALAIAKKYYNKYRIVTLDGEIINSGGSLTGGYYQKSLNLLSRKRIVDELFLQLKEIDLHIDSINKNKNVILLNLNKEQNHLTDLTNDITSKKEELFSLESILNSNLELKENNEINLSDLKNSKVTYDIEKDRLKKDLQLNKEEFNSKNILLLNLSNELKDKKSELYNLSKDIEQKKSNLNKYSFDSLSLSSQKENILKDIEVLKSNNKELGEEVSSKLEENKILLDDIRLLEKNIQENSFELQICDIELDEIFNNKISIDKSINDNINKNKNNILLYKNAENIRISLLQDKIKCENDININNEKIEAVKHKLVSEYDVIIDNIDICNIRDDVKESELIKIQRSIDSLGNINIESIESYDILNERYQVYKTQIEDLNFSIFELEKLIASLEKDMKNDFSDKFNQINKTFNDVFKQIFGGGEGSLVFVDKNDILNSDIEIFAQPPGKKLKTISVLSGGEKALIGIALLFAIQINKPAPFCILDEIDAPLDDANVNRFSRFLKNISNENQFITITHRRGTIEDSDYIYGVTMQEKGVSKIVSLKFDEAEKYIE